MQIEANNRGAERPLSSSRRRDLALAAKASAQYGVIARHQLLELGFSRDQIKRMRQSGRLHDVHRGVHAVGHPVIGVKGRWMAALLASGPEALLSHRSCAALANIRRTGSAYIEVIVPQQRGTIDGIRMHVSRRIGPQDRHSIDGIPCTSVARTLLDLAATRPRREVERACDEAEVQQCFDLAAIEDVLQRSAGCRGAARLRAVLREHAIGTTLTRSELEERALAVLDRDGIRRPQLNVRIVCRAGFATEVDFLWRREGVVLETDGGRFHSTPRQIARDRRKEAELVRAGHRVLRATWVQIEREPREVALMVRAALEA